MSRVKACIEKWNPEALEVEEASFSRPGARGRGDRSRALHRPQLGPQAIDERPIARKATSSYERTRRARARRRAQSETNELGVESTEGVAEAG
jgi:hypothetical protein